MSDDWNNKQTAFVIFWVWVALSAFLTGLGFVGSRITEHEFWYAQLLILSLTILMCIAYVGYMISEWVWYRISD